MNAKKGRYCNEQRETFIRQNLAQESPEFCSGTGHDGNHDTVIVVDNGEGRGHRYDRVSEAQFELDTS